MSETILAMVGYALIGLLIGVIMARKMVGNPSQFGDDDREDWLFVFWVTALLWPLVILAGGVWLVLSGCSRLALRVGRAELRLPRKPGPQDKHRADDDSSRLLCSSGEARADLPTMPPPHVQPKPRQQRRAGGHQ